MGSIVGRRDGRERIRFGPFEIDHLNARLTADGGEVRLRPKTFAVLAYLAERPARLVRKEELLDAIWPDTSVTDTVLKVCIREARDALGDVPRAPRFIETVHRRGYRFIAPVGSHSLPSPLDSLVGRTSELAELAEQMKHTRLLTLTGTGGCGKTSLALEWVRRIEATDTASVTWVELDTTSETASVARAVASSLAIHEQPEADLREAIARCLAVRDGILVLDNCEHVLEPVADLVTSLLRTCPGLKVLATSRESLSTPGERVYPVPPLDEAEAVALFTSRAEAIAPGFEGGPAVTALCRRLDGIPLAIELAATQVKTVGVEAAGDRFGEGSMLLDEGRRGGSSRHRTLRAAIDWSYDLLDDSEKQLFRRLSVFAGGFSLAAVEAVGGVGDPTWTLSRLVEKSLVARSAGGKRFRLLETIRRYAGQKLKRAQEETEVEKQMLGYFVDHAEASASAINGPHRQARLSELDLDHANLTAAFRCASASGRGELASRLASALVWFWFHRGYWTEGRESLAVATALEGSELRPRIPFGAGLLAWTSGDHGEALSLLQESAELARAREDSHTLAYARVFGGMSLASLDRSDEARTAVEEGVSLFRAHAEDPFGTATAVASLGIIAITETRYDRARALLEESVALCSALGDAWALALGMRNLGIVALRSGDTDQAVTLLRESLSVQDANGEKWFLSRSLETLAAALAIRGEAESAAVLFGAGEALRRVIGATILPMYREDYERGLDALESSLASTEIDALWARGRALDWPAIWTQAGL